MTREIDGAEMEGGYGPVIKRRKVECVGASFLAYRQSIEGVSESLDQSEDEEEQRDDSATIFDEDDVEMLRALNPKDWKTQDHYAVLGLSKIRYKATQEDIKKAYRLKALKHHPDKRGQEHISPDSDYFTCIIKAWEILGNPKMRRSYDSVDQHINDKIPSNNEHSKTHFFKVFSKAFERNARWSKKKNVSKLGNESSSRAHVDQFYGFWYNFQSWREFSYNEDDEYEISANEERKMRKAEQMRIRKLVDLAYALDPRIGIFKQEEKDRKQAVKNKRRDIIKARQEEAERKAKENEEISRKAKEAEEAEKKAKEAAQRKVKNSQKQALKKSRKAFCEVVKANRYYAERPDEAIDHMIALDAMCQVFSAEKLKQITALLEKHGRQTYITAMQEATSQQKSKYIEPLPVTKPITTPTENTTPEVTAWSRPQLQLLIKATKIFPVGTQQRWEVIADFINQLHPEVRRSYKEVAAKAKELKQSDPFNSSDFNTLTSNNANENIDTQLETNSGKDILVQLSQMNNEVDQKKSSVQSWVEQTMKSVLQFTKGVVGSNVVNAVQSTNGIKENLTRKVNICEDVRNVHNLATVTDVSTVMHEIQGKKVKNGRNVEGAENARKSENDKTKKVEKMENVNKNEKVPNSHEAEKVDNSNKPEKIGNVKNTERIINAKKRVKFASDRKVEKVSNIKYSEKSNGAENLETVNSVKMTEDVDAENKLRRIPTLEIIDNLKYNENVSNKKPSAENEHLISVVEKMETEVSYRNSECDHTMTTITNCTGHNVDPKKNIEMVKKLDAADSVNILYKYDNYNKVDALDSVVDVAFIVSQREVMEIDDKVESLEVKDGMEKVESIVHLKRAENSDQLGETEIKDNLKRVGEIGVVDNLNEGDKFDMILKISKNKLSMSEKKDLDKNRNTETSVRMSCEVDDNPPWTNVEQQRLEQAMKLYVSGTQKRWEKVADYVQTRNTAECMRRCIELVRMIRKKRAVDKKVVKLDSNQTYNETIS